MATDYPYLYPCSRREAERRGEQELWDKSFRENVCCARAIEASIRNNNSHDGLIFPYCARPVLEEYGFRRTEYVLAHSVKNLGPVVKASDEIVAWSNQFPSNPDPSYGRYFIADTALENLEDFISQVQEAYQALRLFDMSHCDKAAWSESLEGKVLVLSPNTLREDCWDQRNQLWLCTGGFGAEPDARGRAVFATCLGDGEETRWDRQDFTGVLKEELLPEWAEEKLEELRRPKQEKGQAMNSIQ